jgi:hypothetical protein
MDTQIQPDYYNIAEHKITVAIISDTISSTAARSLTPRSTIFPLEKCSRRLDYSL